MYDRFSQTADFSIYEQGWVLIAHGNLDPIGTIQTFPFWQNHCELIIWPLALLYWVWPHAVTLLWLQDICVILAEALAFTWICEIAQRHRLSGDGALLAGAGLVLIVADPWIWWSVSFDFHTEPLALVFAMLLTRDLVNGRRRAWAWVAPMLACTVVAATYLVGIGVGGIISSRRSRFRGIAFACIGVAYIQVVMLVHGNRGSSLGAFAYLAAGAVGSTPSLVALGIGAVTHPADMMQALWVKRVDVIANLAPAGLVGLADPFLMPVVLVVLLTSILYHGLLFAGPIFQSLPVYLFLPIGTIFVLGRLMKRSRGAAQILASILILQVLGWAAVWGPHTATQWLRVSAPAAATLARIESQIPESAQVVVSQGVSGRFAGRADAWVLRGPGAIPISGRETWFIITPSQGNEMQSTAQASALITELAGPIRATLVIDANGVWVFRWNPPRGLTEITVPANPALLSAWASPLAPGTASRPIVSGPTRDWHLTSTGTAGYVADGIEWQEPPGLYEASVTLSTTGPVNVEVWNDNGNILLARRSIPVASGIQTVALPVDATTPYKAFLFSGWGPFRANYFPPPPGQRLEVRVWSAGGETVNVYRAELDRAGQ
jgi:uncharacterized membrane protein